MHPSYFRRPLFLACVSWVLVLCLFKAWGFFDRLSPLDPVWRAPLPGARAEGTVAGFPSARARHLEFLLHCRLIDDQPARGTIWVGIRGTPAMFSKRPGGSSSFLTWRDQVRTTGRLTRSQKEYLWRQGIHAVLWVGSPEDVQRIPGSRSWIFSIVDRARSRMLAVFSREFPKDRAAILSGLILGEKSGLSYGLKRAFRDSGSIYLLVISGIHVSFVLGFVYFFVSFIGWSRAASGALGMAAAGFYTLCAGAGAPLVRAYVTLAAGFTGYLLGRKPGAFQGLLLAFVLLLLEDSRNLFEAGFQMSFAATGALVLALSCWKIPMSWPRPVRYFTGVFLASAAAQSALVPILANTFHNVPLCGVVANLLFVPLAAVLLYSGAVVFLTSFLPWTAPLNLAARGTNLLLGVFEGAVRYWASRSWQISSPSWEPGWCLVYYTAAACLWVFPDPVLRKGFLKWGAAASLAAFCFGWASPARLRVWPLVSDRTRGEPGALFQEPGGRLFLVGAGVSAEAVDRKLRQLKGGRIERVFLDSVDPNSLESLQKLVRVVPVGEVDAPSDLVPGRFWGRFQENLRRRGVSWRPSWGEEVPVGQARVTGDMDRGFSGRPDLDRILWTVIWRGCRYSQFDIMAQQDPDCEVFQP